MQHDSPRQPEGGPEPPRDPLDDLSERVRHAQESAERLVREASEAARAAAAEGGADPRRHPPRGYAVPGEEGGRAATADLQALIALLDLGRTLVPAELREQIAELAREILLLVRAIVDWYLERIDQRRKTPVEVEDIPIS